MSNPLPVTIPFETFEIMKGSRRWLLYKSVPRPDKKPAKIPYYANGQPRSGALDTLHDRMSLVEYDEAMVRMCMSDDYAGLGFALGNDGSGWYWQGIDLDNIVANRLGDIANEWSSGVYSEWNYAELSPSEKGMHIIGYGRPFPSNLGANGTGIEAYSHARFFTFTGREVLPQGGAKRGRIGDLFDYVGQVLYPRWLAGKTVRDSYAGEAQTEVPPTTIAALRSAIKFWNHDSYDDWYRAGLALKELGEVGREIWLTWSEFSEKYNPKDAQRKWKSFQPDGRTNYRSIFKIAMDRSWVNPDGKEALSVRICSRCWATLALPPLRLDLATGELDVGKLPGP